MFDDLWLSVVVCIGFIILVAAPYILEDVNRKKDCDKLNGIVITNACVKKDAVLKQYN